MSAGVQHCLVTGASGGLGSALSLELAAPGKRITLWGRNEERLGKVRALCEAKGARTAAILRDSRDFAQCRTDLRALDDEEPVDMAILNAGVSSGMLPGGGLEPIEDACRTMEVNATGTINMAACLLERMASRGSGHLVFISSIAGLYPLPGSPAYSAAKAALSYYAAGIRLEAERHGVRVSVVYPGYVESPMSKRLKGPQPFRWTAGKAASHILSRLQAGKDSIAFPFFLALGARFLHLLPSPVASFFIRRFSFTVVPDTESPLGSSSGPSVSPPHA